MNRGRPVNLTEPIQLTKPSNLHSSISDGKNAFCSMHPQTKYYIQCTDAGAVLNRIRSAFLCKLINNHPRLGLFDLIAVLCRIGKSL